MAHAFNNKRKTHNVANRQIKMDREMIYKALRGEATPQELEQVARWHSENPIEFQRCADEVHLQIDMMELYGEEIRPASWIVSHWKLVARIAVQAAAMLAVGLFIGGYIGKERTYDLLSEQVNTIQVPLGQRLKLTLPDGSDVQLNAGSSLSYPAVFNKTERKVHLSGEAIFEVFHDVEHPFIVETFACAAKVLGTKFDIIADEQRETFSAALLEGKLQLTNKMSEETMIMAPNEIVYLKNGKLNRRELSDLDNYLWTEGIINLKGLSFEELMVKIERAFNVKIEIKRQQMPDANFDWGKIAISSGIEHALEVLRCAADFEYVIDRESGIITIL